MYNYNLSAGWGRILADGLTPGTTSKVFIVSNSSNPYNQLISELFEVDAEGVQHVFGSITAALAACTAGAGDIVYLAPGYTETVTSAGGITISKSGVVIKSMGNGNLRGIITFGTSAAAVLNVTGANVTFDSVVFTCNIASQTSMVTSTVADTRFLNCLFNTQTAALSALTAITTSGVTDRLVINNCMFLGNAASAGTLTASITLGAGADYTITNNFFVGKATQHITNATTALRGFIDSNKIVTGTGTVAINIAAASTPFISNNNMNVASGTAPIVAAAGFMSGNSYSAAAGVTAPTAATF